MSMSDRHGRFVDPHELLLRTDWNSVENCCPNDAPATPVILRDLLDDDSRKQGAALRDLDQAVTHQNTFYSATPLAASFVAAILGDPGLSPKSPTRADGKSLTSARSLDSPFA